MTAREPPADLTVSLTEVAAALFAPGTVHGTLQQIVDLAVVSIAGCDAAGIFLVEDEQIHTMAFSDPAVVDLDRLQYETDEGPCLDAVSERRTFYARDLSDDPRWPRFGPAAAAMGFRGLLACPLSITRRVSALNLYARLPDAYSTIDRGTGEIFGTLGGIALGSAEERDREDEKATNLLEALRTREIIGQAQGILMERERLTSEQAFDLLRRASQHMNIKLREIAQMLVETGETPPTGSTSSRAPVDH
jgi:ANTAR domain/GAF domain